jgi:hypothetical protein
MEACSPLDHRELWVHHKAQPGQVRIHGRHTADDRMYHGEPRALPGGLIKIVEHGPAAFRPVQRVPWIDLHQPWPRWVNAGNLRQVYT